MPYPISAARGSKTVATAALIAATLTLQPGVSDGTDTRLLEATPTTAGDTATSIDTNPVPASRRLSLLKFDLTSLPAGATVTSATFTVWNVTNTAATKTIDLYAILAANSAWIEGATWDYAVPSTVRWAGDAAANGGTDAGCSVSGTDYNASVIGTFTYPTSTAADTQFDITLNTAMVQAWVNGANYGMVMNRPDVENRLIAFRSSDYVTDTTKRPKLVVNYTYLG